MPKRARLPAPRPPAARPPLPLPALAAPLQRALPRARAEARALVEGARLRNARQRRRPAPARHDAASLWPVDRDDQAQRARALGRLRLLPRPLAPLLGLQARPAL